MIIRGSASRRSHQESKWGSVLKLYEEKKDQFLGHKKVNFTLFEIQTILRILEEFKTNDGMNKELRDIMVAFFLRSSDLMNQLFRKSQDKFFELLKNLHIQQYDKGQRVDTNQTVGYVLHGRVGLYLIQQRKQIGQKWNQPSFVIQQFEFLGHQRELIGNTRQVLVHEDNTILLTVNLKIFEKLFFGIIENQLITHHLEILEQSPVLKVLSPNQMIELAFSSNEMTYRHGEYVVQQGQQTFQNDQAYIYLTSSGTFLLQKEKDPQISKEFLNTQEAFLKAPSTPLMQNYIQKNKYSINGQSKNLSIALINGRELFGFNELKKQHQTWDFSLMAEEDHSKVLVIDLIKLGGVEQFLSYFDEEDFTQLLVTQPHRKSRERMLTCQINDTYEMTNRQRLSSALQGMRLNIPSENEETQNDVSIIPSVTDDQQKKPRSAKYFSKSIDVVDKKKQIFQSILASLEKQVEISHLNTNEVEKKNFDSNDDFNKFLGEKNLVFDKIKTSFKRQQKSSKPLVEEFTKNDPLFLKHLKIKIFRQTYSPYQNGVFYEIKSQTTRRDNIGIYLNKLRNKSQFDQSFIVFNKYQKDFSKYAKKNQRFYSVQQITETDVSQMNPAVKNIKRKLKSSRRQLIERMSSKNFETSTKSTEPYDDKTLLYQNSGIHSHHRILSAKQMTQ